MEMEKMVITTNHHSLPYCKYKWTRSPRSRTPTRTFLRNAYLHTLQEYGYLPLIVHLNDYELSHWQTICIQHAALHRSWSPCRWWSMVCSYSFTNHKRADITFWYSSYHCIPQLSIMFLWDAISHTRTHTLSMTEEQLNRPFPTSSQVKRLLLVMLIMRSYWSNVV